MQSAHLASLLRGAQVFSALRYRDYRLFWLGSLASVTGFQVFVVARGWLVYEITGSPLYLGYVGLVTAVPSILFTLFGGVIADKVDQRRLLTSTQLLSALLMLALALPTLTGAIRVWHILAIAFLSGMVIAFDQPTRQAIFPHLIDRKVLMNAVALNSAIWQGTRVVGPSLAGLIIAWVNTASCFFLSALGFLTLSLVTRVLRMPPVQRARGSVLREMGEGLAFIRRNAVFSFLIGMTFFNSLFGMSYIYLLPVFAKDILGVGPTGLGFLGAASGGGALLGTLIIATLGGFQRKGWLIILGAALFGGFLILFALSPWYQLSLTLAFLAGVSNSIYVISVMTTLQALVPDQFRGRVMGFYGITWSLIPLGSMQSGAIASYFGAPFAVALGGALVVSFALGVALTNPRIRMLGAEAY